MGMRGKLNEMVKFVPILTKQLAANALSTHYYNGFPITSQTGTGIDCQGYTDIEFYVTIGANNVGPITIQHTILGNSVDNPATASAVSVLQLGQSTATPATFTVSQTGAIQVFEASLVCRDTPRFLWLDTNQQGALVTADYSAIAILGNDNQPPSKTLYFDL